MPFRYSSDSVDQMTSETEDVKIQLQTKDMIISDLERELAENIQGKQKVTDLTWLDFSTFQRMSYRDHATKMQTRHSVVCT